MQLFKLLQLGLTICLSQSKDMKLDAISNLQGMEASISLIRFEMYCNKWLKKDGKPNCYWL